MGPGEHRPHDHEYWQRPWARALFAGDLFEAIPFGDQPTIVYTAEQDDASGKHFLGEVAFGYGLLITPTCDMAEQHGTSLAAHPYRVLVPVLPLELIVEQTAAIEKSLGLLRSHVRRGPRGPDPLVEAGWVWMGGERDNDTGPSTGRAVGGRWPGVGRRGL